MERFMPLRRYEVMNVKTGGGGYVRRGGARLAKLTRNEVKYLTEQAIAAPWAKNRFWER